jgi:hypothetical protein|tara:strand:- start:9577 stop:9723 length:147 start_codon:yes stop_codon:yes gene_type:complete
MNGKGDKCRVKKYKKYRENYDIIVWPARKRPKKKWLEKDIEKGNYGSQ